MQGRTHDPIPIRAGFRDGVRRRSHPPRAASAGVGDARSAALSTEGNSMTDAFIFDHVRTPRGRGRPDGSLHEISSVQLTAQVLQALERRGDVDTSLIDDVVL